MDALQQLVEVEAIKRLKARYFRFFDTAAWDDWLALFTEDMVLEFDNAVPAPGRDDLGTIRLEGKDKVRGFVTSPHILAETVHHGHMPEIEILSDTEARGVWAMEDIVDRGHDIIHGYGHYHETYVRQDGEWRIRTVRLTRLRLVQTTWGRNLL